MMYRETMYRYVIFDLSFFLSDSIYQVLLNTTISFNSIFTFHIQFYCPKNAHPVHICDYNNTPLHPLYEQIGSTHRTTCILALPKLSKDLRNYFYYHTTYGFRARILEIIFNGPTSSGKIDFDVHTINISSSWINNLQTGREFFLSKSPTMEQPMHIKYILTRFSVPRRTRCVFKSGKSLINYLPTNWQRCGATILDSIKHFAISRWKPACIRPSWIWYTTEF